MANTGFPARRGARAFRQIVLVLILSVALASCGSQEPSEIVPSGWQPSLKAPVAFVEEEAEANAQPSQQFLNRSGQSLAALSDAQLFIAYVSLMQVLDQPGRKSLLAEQREWLQQRQEQARQAVESQGGSLAPLEFSSAFREITLARLETLKKRLREKSKNPDDQK